MEDGKQMYDKYVKPTVDRVVAVKDFTANSYNTGKEQVSCICSLHQKLNIINKVFKSHIRHPILVDHIFFKNETYEISVKLTSTM